MFIAKKKLSYNNTLFHTERKIKRMKQDQMTEALIVLNIGKYLVTGIQYLMIFSLLILKKVI